MALILVSGLPCSGRTTRSQELMEDLARRITTATPAPGPRRIVHLTNADANVDRSAFDVQLQEKPARAAFLSLVMRSLAVDTIVIADGGAGTNIKGFRYQLWCAAREVGVRVASILCVARPDVCQQRNEGRIAQSGDPSQASAYLATTLEELLLRFEEPNPMTRWDAPLFVVDCNPTDEAETSSREAMPFEAIWQAITTGEVKRAPDVVAPVRATTGDYLSMLETTTQAVLSALQVWQSSGTLPELGGHVQLTVVMPGGGGDGDRRGDQQGERIGLNLPAGKRPPTTATLQRLRRQFVRMHASSAAAQNEIGFAMGQEGRRASALPAPGTQTAIPGMEQGNTRVERKIKQHHASAAAQQQAAQASKGSASRRTPQQEIAHRFVAYLEETL